MSGPTSAGTANAGTTSAGTTSAGTTSAGTTSAGTTSAGATSAGATSAGTTSAARAGSRASSRAFRRIAALSLALIALGSGAARAQTEPDTPPQPEAELSQEEARRQAAEHFDRGIAFYNEERYDAALAELARAYELAPAHQVLYNLARVHAALGHAVQAAEAYEEYLRAAGDAIDPARRREAEQALEQQRSRIGRLLVRVDVEGAVIAIDGVDVASAPLEEPLPLSAGTHTLEVRAPGRESVRRAVSVAGQTDQTIELELREELIPRGNLRVQASVPEVAITVDGEPVGITPLSSTLPLRAGEHVVTATRAGYLSQRRRVVIEEGAEAEVTFEMRRDPQPEPDEIGQVTLRLPDAPYLVRVNDETMLSSELELPAGAHRITLEVTGRRPYEGTLRVPAGSAVVIVPPLAWTLESRRARLEGAAQQRTLGQVLTVAGALVAAGGAAVLIWNEAEFERTNSRVREINAILEECDITGHDDECRMAEDEGRQLSDDQQTQLVLRGVSIAATAVGAGLAAVGLGLWIAAPSEDEIDAAARGRARLRIGPSGIELDGRF